MRELTYPVPADADGMAVGSFLRRRCGVSSKLLSKIKRVERGITRDGEPVRTIDLLRAGEALRLRLPEDDVRVEPADLPLEVVYEDDDLLVVDKPAGIAVHPSAFKPEPTLAAAVVGYYQRRGYPGSFRPVNRLDRNTTGLLLAAKNAHVAHLLTGQTRKVYLAVALGRMEGEGVIEQPLRIREGSAITREVGEGGQYALTRWRSLAADGELSLLRVVIETGRTHQIRAHMAWLGHPLAGDTMYGEDTYFAVRQQLHCARMDFFHPLSGKALAFTAPLPADMAGLLASRGWKHPEI